MNKSYSFNLSTFYALIIFGVLWSVVFNDKRWANSTSIIYVLIVLAMLSVTIIIFFNIIYKKLISKILVNNVYFGNLFSCENKKKINTEKEQLKAYKYRYKFRMEKFLQRAFDLSVFIIFTFNLKFSFMYWVMIFILIVIRIFRSIYCEYYNIWNVRDNLFTWINERRKPMLPIFLLYSNVNTSGMTTFDRDLDNRLSYSFVLLDSIEFLKIKHNSYQALFRYFNNLSSYENPDYKEITQIIENESEYVFSEYCMNWCYLWITRHYYLIDLSKLFDEKIYNQFLKSYYIPHVNVFVFLIDTVIHPSWEKYVDVFKYVKVKNIDSGVIGSYNNLEKIIDPQVDIDDKIVAQSVYEMGEKFHLTYFEFKRAPFYFYRFFKDSICKTSYIQSIFQLFEYTDMIMRIYCYFLISFNSGRIYDKINIGRSLSNYKNLAKRINKEIFENELLHKLLGNINQSYPVSIISEYIPKLELQCKCKIAKTNSITFFGVAKLLSFIRNKTKGHGVLTENMSLWLYPLMIKLIIIMTESLKISSLKINNYGYKKFEIGINSNIANIYPFAICDEKGCFLFLHEVSQKKLTYLNYDTGEYFKPKITELDLEEVEQ